MYMGENHGEEVVSGVAVRLSADPWMRELMPLLPLAIVFYDLPVGVGRAQLHSLEWWRERWYTRTGRWAQREAGTYHCPTPFFHTNRRMIPKLFFCNGMYSAEH